MTLSQLLYLLRSDAVICVMFPDGSFRRGYVDNLKRDSLVYNASEMPIRDICMKDGVALITI